MTAALSISAFNELSCFAHELAEIAGRTILPFFRQDLLIDNKAAAAAGFDPVTQADKRAEFEIRRLINQRYPSHGIMGEEYGFEAGTSNFTWVIDPIDGTRAFMCGMAQWGTLIALNDGARPIIGILDQPYMKERWIGTAQSTMFRREGAETLILKARHGIALHEATLSTTSPVGYFNDYEQRAFWALSNEVRLTRFGGDCYGYGLLAHGFIDIIVESRLKPWDIQALIPIIEGAGGVVTDWEGRSCYDGGQVVACGDPTLHGLVLQTLAAAR